MQNPSGEDWLTLRGGSKPQNPSETPKEKPSGEDWLKLRGGSKPLETSETPKEKLMASIAPWDMIKNGLRTWKLWALLMLPVFLVSSLLRGLIDFVTTNCDIPRREEDDDDNESSG